MSRGKSVAQGAGESARHRLTPRPDTGSALPEDNTRYLRYLSTDGSAIWFARAILRNCNKGLTFRARSPSDSNNRARGVREALTPSSFTFESKIAKDC